MGPQLGPRLGLAPNARSTSSASWAEEAECVERCLGGNAAPALRADESLDILGRDLYERHVAERGREVRAQRRAVSGQGGGPSAEALKVLDQALARSRH